MTVEGPCGLLVIDKPPGPTSHDVVHRVRQRLGVKAGHTGTLDPLASGVLPVCLGATTRLARFLQLEEKVYDGTVRLGWATTTYDAEGEPLAEPREPPEVEVDEVRAALEGFIGEIEQRPPAYSAKKIRGQPAYRRARRGEDVRPEPVGVRIDVARLVGMERGQLRIRVHCGPGTYMRTLAHDLGAILGCPSHLEALRRVSNGAYSVEDAVTWDQLEEWPRSRLVQAVIEPAEMLAHWSAVSVDDDGVRQVATGGVVASESYVSGTVDEGSGGPVAPLPGAWVRVLDSGGLMLAAAEVLSGGGLQPRVVLR